MIILTLMIITLGLIGVNIQDLVKQQRFKSEVALIVEQLRLAQDLMLMLNTDALVRFSKDKKGIITTVEVETKLSKGWQRELKRQHAPLSMVALVEFEDQITGTKTANFPLELTFLSGGSVMSQGMLHLVSQDRQQESFICLPGYPKMIDTVLDPKKDPNCHLKSEIDFFEKLTFYTRREVEEREQKNAFQK